MKTIGASIFEDIWKSSSAGDPDEIQNYWNQRASEFNSHSNDPSRGNDTFELIKFLESKGFVNKNSSILDVGCGAGRYSNEFAKSAANVTGTDISPEMLRYAKRNAEIQKLDNVRYILSPWQNLDIDKLSWNKKFDLVFASMTPAVNSADALSKIISASKKYCFMSGFVFRKSSLQDKISNALNVEKKRNSNSIYCAFNILWNMKIYPEITYKNVKWENYLSSNEAVELSILNFSRNNKVDYNTKYRIKKCIENESIDGRVKSITDAKIAWMTWEV
jgi:SAM-dependent methyltransferase